MGDENIKSKEKTAIRLQLEEWVSAHLWLITTIIAGLIWFIYNFSYGKGIKDAERGCTIKQQEVVNKYENEKTRLLNKIDILNAEKNNVTVDQLREFLKNSNDKHDEK